MFLVGGKALVQGVRGRPPVQPRRRVRIGVGLDHVAVLAPNDELLSRPRLEFGEPLENIVGRIWNPAAASRCSVPVASLWRVLAHPGSAFGGGALILWWYAPIFGSGASWCGTPGTRRPSQGRHESMRVMRTTNGGPRRDLRLELLDAAIG